MFLPVDPTQLANTAVVAVALLFAVTGSDSNALTVAVLLLLPAVVPLTVKVTVAEAPLFSVPSAQFTLEVPEQLPWLLLADTNTVPAGMVSINVTALAVWGPILVTCKV